MIKRLITTAAAGIILLGVAVPLYAQGRSQSAPGQVKKGTTEVVIGTVENVNTSTSTVDVMSKGQAKKEQVQLSTTTPIFNEKNKAVKLGAVKLKDLIAVISTDSGVMATPGGKLKVKKIFVMNASESAQMSRRAVMGIITQISSGSMTLVHQIQRNKTYQVSFDANTIITGKDASGSASLVVGQRVTAVGHLADGGGILAKRIHIIPGKATGIFRKQPLATPSGEVTPVATGSGTPTPEATISATPTVEPTATPTEEVPSPTPTI